MKVVLLDKYKPYKKKKKKIWKGYYIVYAIAIFIGITTGFGAKKFFLDVCFHKNKYILYSKSFFNINRGDKIIINIGDYWLIRIVVGLPKEEIEIRNNNIFINGKLLKGYTMKEKPFLVSTYKQKLQKDEYFVISLKTNIDSRHFGAIKHSHIKGKVLWETFF